MTRPSWNELMRRLAAHAEETDGRDPPPVPSDAELTAYRDGRLDDADRSRVEHALGNNIAARDRLVKLAGLEEPPAELRGRILDGPDEATRFRPTAPSWLLPGLGLAAAAAVILVVMNPFRDDAGRELPPGLVFDVRVEAAAAVRSTDAPPTSTPVLPSTSVSIYVEPPDRGTPGLEFGLYRVDGDRLRRVTESDGLQVEQAEGAAKLVVPARAIGGDIAGSHPFVVAIAREGVLPDERIVADANRLDESLRDTDPLLAYTHSITIAPTP
ncbi:MAG: hypothetical protein AAF533_19075 [Acidobacteriota bacterium]